LPPFDFKYDEKKKEDRTIEERDRKEKGSEGENEEKV
jgi:hypothetical protein